MRINGFRSMAKKRKIRYRQQRAGRSSLLRQFRSTFVGADRPQIRVNMSSYRKAVSGHQQAQLKLRLVKSVFVFLSLSACLFFAIQWGYRTLERSATFRVRKITVQGNRMTSKAQVLALADIKQGTELLGFNADIAEKRIQDDFWIDHAKIERSWPYTLNIRVYEHRPMAIINIEDGEKPGLYYIDHHGQIFAPVGHSQELDFPVITGYVLSEGAEKLLGEVLTEQKNAGDAYDFLRFAALGNPILPLQSISEIHVSRKKGIIVYLVERAFPIYVGCGNVKNRYYQLVKLLERFYRKEEIEEIKEIRMDYQAGRILVVRSEP